MKASLSAALFAEGPAIPPLDSVRPLAHLPVPTMVRINVTCAISHVSRHEYSLDDSPHFYRDPSEKALASSAKNLELVRKFAEQYARL